MRDTIGVEICRAGIPVDFSGSLLAAWDGTVVSVLGYDEVQVQVTGLVGGDAIAVKGSTNIDGSNPVTLTGVDLSAMTTLNSIVANGLYSFPASSTATYVKTGAGAAPTVNLLRR